MTRPKTCAAPRRGCVHLSAAVPAAKEALARRVWCGRALAAAWQAEPRFLLRELGLLLPAEKRPVLLELWPGLLVQAERAFK